MSHPLRVLYFGTYRANYSRNRILIEGLRRNGVQVMECHETLWHGVEDRVQAVSGGWKHPSFWWRIFRAYARLLWKYRQIDDYDVMVVGYPGHLDVFLARLLTWLHGKPLVWDIFMSIYLIALERGLESKSRFGVSALRQVERLACHLPNRLVIDTKEYARWFEQTHNVPGERFTLIPTGADDRIFRPLATSSLKSRGDLFQVLYYGSFIPNHGVLTIVEAAKLLAKIPDIRFEFVGHGPLRKEAEQLAVQLQLANVAFTDWLAPEILRRRIAQADLCLGAFGNTPQSLMTVQNKIYECLAMARPVTTGDGPAIREAMIHGQHIWLCPRENPKALAEAIQVLRAQPELRKALGRQGHTLFLKSYTVQRNGERFKMCLQGVT